MARIIGIDFGNWMTYICSLTGMNEETKLGGHFEDLIPNAYSSHSSRGSENGIPNEYFWGSVRSGAKTEIAELCGFELLDRTVFPAENRLRLLKKYMGKEVTLSSGGNNPEKRTVKYDDVIVHMFEYYMRLANEALRSKLGDSAMTNLVSVSYPASFGDPNVKQYYINLIQRADSGVRDEKGNMKKIRVVGAVCEPAAAGLNCLSELAAKGDAELPDNVTYGVFDLGGGTFDLSIVSLFPKGKKRPNGRKYFFEEVCDGGINVAGSDFTNRLRDLFISKAKKVIGEGELTRKQLKDINEKVEICKMGLSTRVSVDIALSNPYDDDDDYIVTVTREEFEQAISADVDRIINFTRNFFDEHKERLPQEILMTGGSSNIPYIQSRLKEALPKYADKIFLHEPSKAAAYGAARFYDPDYETALAGQETTKPGQVNTPPRENSGVLFRTVSRDIGVLVQDGGIDQIFALIKSGTEIPCDSGEQNFHTLGKTQRTAYDLYRANKTNPDPKQINQNYGIIRKITLQYGREVPAETKTSCRLTIDSLGMLHLTAWEDDNRAIKVEEKFTFDVSSDN